MRERMLVFISLCTIDDDDDDSAGSSMRLVRLKPHGPGPGLPGAAKIYKVGPLWARRLSKVLVKLCYKHFCV